MVFFMSILQTTGLKKYYGAELNITKALDGVNLSIEQGEFVAIVGTSGSGKSTLLNMIGGLDVPTTGKVIVDGKELSALNDEQLTIFRRRKIGFIFQNYNLVPVLNVYENIVLPMPPAGLRLGQLLYQDLDIGSVDIYDFLKKKQPLLSLHGHIHESPDTEKGKWINQILDTACIQTGQTELNDNNMVYAEIDLQSREYSRKITNVK